MRDTWMAIAPELQGHAMVATVRTDFLRATAA